MTRNLICGTHALQNHTRSGWFCVGDRALSGWLLILWQLGGRSRCGGGVCRSLRRLVLHRRGRLPLLSQDKNPGKREGRDDKNYRGIVRCECTSEVTAVCKN